MDTPLHTDFVPRLEGGGVWGLGVAEDLNAGKADPVGGTFTLPATLDVEVIQTIVINLAGGEGKRGRERERERERERGEERKRERERGEERGE